MKRWFHIIGLCTVGAVMLALGPPSQAGCPCQGTAPLPMELASVAMETAVPVTTPFPVQAFPVSVMPAPAPPPGTLGKTYQLRSRPIPTDKHPRAAMIQVRVSGATDVIAHDINPSRTESQADGFRDACDPNLWYFITEPLYPGLPHIYRVEMRCGTEIQERYVRVIMGRIVELTF